MWRQAPQDGAEFMVASGEWPPPTGTSQRDRFVAALLADLQVLHLRAFASCCDNDHYQDLGCL